MANSLAETYRRHAEDFWENLQKCVSLVNDKDIHQLRLSVKHMRAIFKLAGFFKEWPYHFTLEFGEVHEIFEIAGRLREIQMNRKILGKLKEMDLSNYKMALIDQETQCKRELLELLENFSTDRYGQVTEYFTALIETIEEDKLLSDTEHFIQQQEQQIAELRAISTGFENYHRIRKHLKQIGIVLRYASDKAESPRNQIYRSEFDKLETMLGSWHDTEVFKNSIQQFAESTTDKPNKEIAKELILLLTEANKLCATEIGGLLDKLIRHRENQR
ncbi:CHAD domain-containing protein [Mangrovibacterium diazotrophicum]|nr:CHAD domain-containing protein [Mangrovibacterium diazotrophicum]